MLTMLTMHAKQCLYTLSNLLIHVPEPNVLYREIMSPLVIKDRSGDSVPELLAAQLISNNIFHLFCLWGGIWCPAGPAGLIT